MNHFLGMNLAMSRHWIPSVVVVTLLIATMAGCGDGGPATAVSGKVTTGGSPVVGTIHFVGADGKEKMSPIGPTGGTYMIADPPMGEVTVLVKGDALATPEKPPTIPGAATPATPSGLASNASTSVAPPKKYADASGGLKYTVVAGRQTKDFDLAP